MVCVTCVTGDHSKKDQTLSVKMEKYIDLVCTLGPTYYGPP